MQALESLEKGAFHLALMQTDSAEYYTPQLADVNFLRGKIFSELGNFDRAGNAYEKVVLLDPYYRAAWFKLGNIAFSRKKYRDALSYYRKELVLAQEEAKWRDQSVDHKRQCTTLLQIGFSYNRIGKQDSAALAFHQAIALDSSFAEAYHNLGYLYNDLGDAEKALHYSFRALKLEPQNAEFRYLAGVLCFRNGRAAEAVGHLEIALEQRPWYFGAYYNLGQALMRLGRREEGKRYLAMVDSMQSLHHEIDLAQTVVELFPHIPKCWQDLAELLRQAGRLNEAMHAYKVALSLDPHNKAAQKHITNLQRLSGYRSAENN